MTNEEFEVRKKETASNLQLLLDEMRQLHDWIVLNPVKKSHRKTIRTGRIRSVLYLTVSRS